MTLYAPWLDRFSDEAVCWLIAHELGHVVGHGVRLARDWGRPFTRMSGDDSREITVEERDGREKVADAIARAWGFWIE